MSQADLVSLVAVLAAAATAVFAADALRRLLVPLVVLEILAGVAIGPQLLGFAQVTPLVAALARLGVCFLFFLAGYEIEIERVRGLPLRLGGIGWLCSAALGCAAALLLRPAGLDDEVVPVAVALTTTALGVLLPILRDSGVLETPLGAATLGAGAFGEFGPIVLLALFLGSSSFAHAALWLLVFCGVVVAVAVTARRVRPRTHVRLLHGTLTTSAQLVVRGSVLVLLLLVLLATRLGLDLLLGAFCAGLIVRLADPIGDAAVLRQRIDAVGFGFLIPVFFVVTGMRLDVAAFAAGPGAALLLVSLVAAFLVVRGVPAVLCIPSLGAAGSAALALFTATQLPLVVVITDAARARGMMTPATASALIGAGMVSVAVYPLLALRTARHAAAGYAASTPPGTAPDRTAAHGPAAIDPRRTSREGDEPR